MSNYKFSSAQKLNTSMESKTKNKNNNTQATNNDPNTEKM